MLIALILALTLDDPAAAAVAAAPAGTPAREASAQAPQGLLQLPRPRAEPAPAPALRFVWRDHPSLRAGRNFRADFSLKIQEDARNPGDDPVPFPTWQLARTRFGVDGEVFRKIQFSIEREFSQDLVTDPTRSTTKSPWKDVYVELNLANAIQIRGGKFKVPYGLDQASGESNLDFVYRSLGGDYLSPGRDIGGMAHGRFFKRALNYWAGVFKEDGENSRSSRIAGADTTVSGRVTGTPFARVKVPGLKDAEVGGSFATSSLPDDKVVAGQLRALPNGLRSRTPMSQFTFFEPVFVKGTRRRYGLETDWTKGPGNVRAEYMLVTDTREKQGLGDENLSNVRGKAWYVLGSWVVTGEKKDRPVEPRKGGIGRGGVGAVELAARYDTLRFDSVVGQDPPFRNSRAETILPNEDRVFTVGLTYFANRWGRIQLNLIHDNILDLDANRTPTVTGKFWSSVCRFQFEL